MVGNAHPSPPVVEQQVHVVQHQDVHRPKGIRGCNHPQFAYFVLLKQVGGRFDLEGGVGSLKEEGREGGADSQGAGAVNCFVLLPAEEITD